MQRSEDGQEGNPQWQAYTNVPAAAVGAEGRQRSRNRRAGCLIWGMVAALCLALAALIVFGSGLAGWNAGLRLARESGASTAAAELQLQCDRLATDVESGNHQLLRTRIEFLRAQTPLPACLIDILPTATALHLRSLPTETPLLASTATSVPAEATIMFASVTAPAMPTTAASLEYDLDSLLSEAQSDFNARAFSRAIDTLDAIIAIDPGFQRERVRGLYFDALTAQALTLFRTFKLSEAIVLTNRAEAFGDVGELAYERSIASTYLDGLRLKLVNPGESVSLFSAIAYTYGHSNYMNGQILSELQEAHHNYAEALVGRGDYCRAREQYDAALALNPAFSNVSRGIMIEKRNQAAASCPDGSQDQLPRQTSGATSGSQTSTTVAPVAVGARPTPAPVGQSG